MNDTLIILGSHPGTRKQFDFERTDCDIWIFNEALSKAEAPDAKETDKWLSRADAVFQMHIPTVWRNPQNRNDQYHADWLKSGNTPVIYMMEAYEEVPKAVAYPLDEVLEDIGGDSRKYMTSSVALAMGLAVYLNTQNKYKRVEVYGVEMETETEYIYQRDAIGYWHGVFDGRGIEIDMNCNFLRERYVYGYEGQVTIDFEDFELRLKELRPELAKMNAIWEKAYAGFNDVRMDYAMKPRNEDAFMELVKQLVEHAANVGLYEGSVKENEDYITKAEEMQKASDGEFMFVRQEFEQRQQAHHKSHTAAAAAQQAAAGEAMGLFRHIATTGNKKKRIARMNKFTEKLVIVLNLSMSVGLHHGSRQENHLYARKLDKLVRAAGGDRSEQAITGADAPSAASALTKVEA